MPDRDPFSEEEMLKEYQRELALIRMEQAAHDKLAMWDEENWMPSENSC